MIRYDPPQREIEPDLDPDFSFLEDATDDESVAYAAERLAARDRDEWQMVGIRASCWVYFDLANNGGYAASVKITTTGCWNIESDSGEEYFEEIYQEELVTLRAILAEMNAQPQPQA